MIVLPISTEGAVPTWAMIELQGDIALREGLEEKDLQVGTLAISCLVRPFSHLCATGAQGKLLPD